MAKFVPDVTTNRWVVIAEGRLKRPHEPAEAKAPAGGAAGGGSKVCVFCPGNENPPAGGPGEEVFRIGTGQAYGPGWEVRVIKNKYPITDFHEVIIHSPSDTDDIDRLPLDQVVKIIQTYRQRYNFHSQNGHVMIFNNVGENAGASISHPHSQLVVVPRQINIDSLALEPTINVVEDNRKFVVFCPEFSQWPFEAWIAPKAGGEMFGQITDEAIEDLAEVLQNILRRLLTHLSKEREGQCHFHPGVPQVAFEKGPAYNFYIHHGENWYLRIIPRTIHRAGFELGTGLSVNIVDPTEAAEVLREERIDELA
ncbi:hypothetical protein HYW40_01770 [Candidatus Curtissbacteria bacterium]|nr:hypothetical protein [Candidatus Curtissbacteria bacterium]